MFKEKEREKPIGTKISFSQTIDISFIQQNNILEYNILCMYVMASAGNIICIIDEINSHPYFKLRVDSMLCLRVIFYMHLYGRE